MLPRTYFVYITMNDGGTVLYTGMTNDLPRRIAEHCVSGYSSFATRYRAHRLIYYETFDTARAAIAREKQIKRWSRKKKERLIRMMNPKLLDLCEEVVRFHSK